MHFCPLKHSDSPKIISIRFDSRQKIDSSDSIRLHVNETQQVGGRGRPGWGPCTACSLAKYGCPSDEWWRAIVCRDRDCRVSCGNSLSESNRFDSRIGMLYCPQHLPRQDTGDIACVLIPENDAKDHSNDSSNDNQNDRCRQFWLLLLLRFTRHLCQQIYEQSNNSWNVTASKRHHHHIR